VRIAFLSCVPGSGSRARHSVARAVTTLLALCFSATLALADVHNFTCSAGYLTGKLCKAGSGIGCSGGNNPTDILNITGTTAASVITFTFTNGSVASSIQVTGQSGTTSQSPNNPVVLTTSGQVGSTSGPGDADGHSDYKVDIDPNHTSATYTVRCSNAASPGLSLSKSPSPTTYTAAGQPIIYTYAVTNTGNVPITNISIADDKLSGITCVATTLAVGASTTCTGNLHDHGCRRYGRERDQPRHGLGSGP
jgi:uncharacterized repeat protein (TIGR01451 family)